MKLCQVTALVGGKKPQTTKEITAVYHRFQKPPLFQGLKKRFQPKKEDGDTFPDENQKVQFQVKGCLAELQKSLSTLWDLVSTQDNANCKAKADVVVDNKTILAQVPVTHLLFLEKQLVDLRTALSEIPVLDPQDAWSVLDSNTGMFTSEMTKQNKTKKVMKTLVKAEATDKHPAQVDVFTEDEIIGQWEITKLSGAISLEEKNAMLARLTALLDAVQCSREQANTMDVEEVKVGDSIFAYLFGKK